MGDIRTSANAAFRDFVTDGVPASGDHEPVKSDVRATFGVVEDRVDAVSAVANSAAAGRRAIASVRVRSTADVVIASALENGDTLNGLTLATGNRVFLGSQTAPAENGIYVVAASGAASRATDADSAADLSLVEFLIEAGDVGGGEVWHMPLEADEITLGTTALAFVKTGVDVSLTDARLRIEDNIAVGPDAGVSFTTGTGSTFIGEGAGRDTEAGSDIVALGRAAGRGNVTGSLSLFAGVAAGLVATAAQESVALGYEAGGYGALGQRLTLVGSRSGNQYAGNDTTAVGAYTLHNLTGGSRITAVGAYAGNGGGNTQFQNTYLGYNAGGAGIGHVAADNLTAIGAGSYCTAENQVTLGNDAVEDVRACQSIMYRANHETRSYYVGNAGNRSPDNLSCLGMGDAALVVASGATNCVSIGDLAMQSYTGGNGVTAVGARSLNAATTLIDTVAVGNRAGALMTTGVGDSIVGFRALEHATQARNNSVLGDSAFWRYQGSGGVAIGYRVAEYTTSGDESVYIGRATGVNRADGERCVFIGAEAGGFHTATVDPDDGTGAVAAGDRVIGIGYRALALTTGDDHVAIGDSAGLSLTGGSGSVFVGSGAGNNASQKVAPVNQVVIGDDAFGTLDNEVTLGNASITRTVLRGVQKGTTYTVAALPSASGTTAGAGARAFVTDANATTFASIVAGGGANGVPVYSDGTNWRIG